MEVIWESMFKLKKSILKDRPVYKESLRTFLIDVESTFYSRPLLLLKNDINDLDELTPNHSLIATQPFYFNPNMKCKKLIVESNGRQFKHYQKCFGIVLSKNIHHS